MTVDERKINCLLIVDYSIDDVFVNSQYRLGPINWNTVIYNLHLIQTSTKNLCIFAIFSMLKKAV